MSGRLSMLSPRGLDHGIEDLASPSSLITRQRVGRRQHRLRTNRRARRMGRLAVVLAVGTGLLAAGALGVGWLLTAPRFAVARVEVRGHARLSPDEIVAASGLAPGVNLFRVDPRVATLAVETLPQIRRAEVIRSFPNHLAIVVEERRPFTLVHAGRLHWIDEQGTPVAQEPRAVAVGLPVISGLSPEELAAAPGEPSERLTAGVSLLRLLLRSGSPLTSQISEIDVSRKEGPVLYTVDGIEVRIGTEEWEARIGRLLGVLAQVASSGQAVSSIDLRFRDQVVLRPVAP